jgi:outer membrane lipoprotein SlyB
MDKTQLIRLLIGISVGAVLGGIMGYFGKCTSGTCPLTATPWRGAIYGAVMGALIAFSLKKN